jgi:hypothetical protein
MAVITTNLQLYSGIKLMVLYVLFFKVKNGRVQIDNVFLLFIVLFTLPSWQLLFPNKSLQAYFLTEIDVVHQNCKTKNSLLTLRVILEQFQTAPGRSFHTLLY